MWTSSALYPEDTSARKASDTFISRLVGVKGSRKGNSCSDAQHRSPSHEIRVPSLNLI